MPRYRASDWSDLLTSRKWMNRYKRAFRGDGWYLLVLDGTDGENSPAVLFVETIRGDLQTRGWWLSNDAEAWRIIGDVQPLASIREQEF